MPPSDSAGIVPPRHDKNPEEWKIIWGRMRQSGYRHLYPRKSEMKYLTEHAEELNWPLINMGKSVCLSGDYIIAYGSNPLVAAETMGIAWWPTFTAAYDHYCRFQLTSTQSIASAPSQATAAPKQATAAPSHATPAPKQATAAPSQAAAAPSQATAAPKQATAALSQATATPSQATAAPSQATAAPSQATAAPSQATAAPSQATAAPKQATAAPEQAAAALMQATAMTARCALTISGSDILKPRDSTLAGIMMLNSPLTEKERTKPEVYESTSAFSAIDLSDPLLDLDSASFELPIQTEQKKKRPAPKVKHHDEPVEKKKKGSTKTVSNTSKNNALSAPSSSSAAHDGASHLLDESIEHSRMIQVKVYILKHAMEQLRANLVELKDILTKEEKSAMKAELFASQDKLIKLYDADIVVLDDTH